MDQVMATLRRLGSYEPPKRKITAAKTQKSSSTEPRQRPEPWVGPARLRQDEIYGQALAEIGGPRGLDSTGYQGNDDARALNARAPPKKTQPDLGTPWMAYDSRLGAEFTERRATEWRLDASARIEPDTRKVLQEGFRGPGRVTERIPKPAHPLMLDANVIVADNARTRPKPGPGDEPELGPGVKEVKAIDAHAFTGYEPKEVGVHAGFAGIERGIAAAAAVTAAKAPGPVEEKPGKGVPSEPSARLNSAAEAAKGRAHAAVLAGL